MSEWIYAVQRLIDYIDDHAVDNPSLSEISKEIGYSPWYCSEQFHRVVGMTIKEYMAKRRLTFAALALRDTDMPIADVALEYGFSSQQALTRAFNGTYGCSPSAYRRRPVPIPFTMKKIVVTPSNYTEQGDFTMSNLVIDKSRIIHYIGQANWYQMKEIDKALGISVGLESTSHMTLCPVCARKLHSSGAFVIKKTSRAVKKKPCRVCKAEKARNYEVSFIR